MDGKRFRKRALALAAATVTTVSALSLGMAGTTNAATFPLGDVNLDGKVNLKDAQLALKGALCIIKLDDMQFKAADVNKDNKVNLKDAQKILKGALMIEKIEGEITDTPPTTPPIETENPIEPTETAVPTTTPAPQPTETTDDGVEGVDWKWETKYGMHVYCYCGEFLDVDENGFLIVNQEEHQKHITSHQLEGMKQHAIDAFNNGLSWEEYSSSSHPHGGYVVKPTTETYKVRLK